MIRDIDKNDDNDMDNNNDDNDMDNNNDNNIGVKFTEPVSVVLSKSRKYIQNEGDPYYSIYWSTEPIIINSDIIDSFFRLQKQYGALLYCIIWTDDDGRANIVHNAEADGGIRGQYLEKFMNNHMLARYAFLFGVTSIYGPTEMFKTMWWRIGSNTGGVIDFYVCGGLQIDGVNIASMFLECT